MIEIDYFWAGCGSVHVCLFFFLREGMDFSSLCVLLFL